jgi:hypothetical protein
MQVAGSFRLRADGSGPAVLKVKPRFRELLNSSSGAGDRLLHLPQPIDHSGDGIYCGFWAHGLSFESFGFFSRGYLDFATSNVDVAFIIRVQPVGGGNAITTAVSSA